VDTGLWSNDPGRPRHEYCDFCVAATSGFARSDLLLALAETTAQLCVSGDVYAEYEEVIRRPKFNRSEAIIRHALPAIRENGFWVKPSEKVRVCSDPDDDIFLECAQVRAPATSVTGNAKDFPVRWAGTQIVTARLFLDAVVSGCPLMGE
jgi:predicted nucleic acid-binding protein